MTMNNAASMKAIILAAGVGSRIRPLTDNCPKSLLKVGGNTILKMMIANIRQCGIEDIVLVLGYLQDQIRDFVATTFPDLKVTYIVNEHYTQTNTGYSLMLSADAVKGSAFIKFDADVVFDKSILQKLIDSEYENCLCIDSHIQLNAEEIKVVTQDGNRVLQASKTLNPRDAVGESIGIEKISQTTSVTLFNELRLMMADQINHQEYYEAAYERLMILAVPFFALDITGLKWIEIDTAEDFSMAADIFHKDPENNEVLLNTPLLDENLLITIPSIYNNQHGELNDKSTRPAYWQDQ